MQKFAPGGLFLNFFNFLLEINKYSKVTGLMLKIGYFALFCKNGTLLNPFPGRWITKYTPMKIATLLMIPDPLF